MPREARITDVPQIINLAEGYESRLMPYIYQDWTVVKYFDAFWVTPSEGPIQGAIHCCYPNNDRDAEFLHDVKGVPLEIVKEFQNIASNGIFLSHIICPGKGTFGQIVRHLKTVSDCLYCYLSIKSPAFESYKRHGFKFSSSKKIWNPYKNGYSECSLGIWL